MAYFPNSSAGDKLEQQCSKCIHADPDALCPINMVQAIFNYDQINNEPLREALSYLVGKDGICRMKPYIDKLRAPQPKDEQLKMWE